MSFGQADIAVAAGGLVQDIGIGISSALLAKKQAEHRAKLSRKRSLSEGQRAAQDLQLQMQAQMYKKPSIMPLILAGVGSLISLGVLIFFVTK